MTTFFDYFGLHLDEIFAARAAARRSLDSELVQASRRALQQASPSTCQAVRSALVSPCLCAYSEAGRAMFVQQSRDEPESIATWDGVLHILADPVVFSDVAIWCLFFATVEAAAAFQLNHCPSPSEEGHLSGLLLGALEGRCEQWRRLASAPLERSGSSLSLQRIDLSILGGEQASGGDFGLVLEFEPHTSPLTLMPQTGTARRVVPLVFQAKRYVRPTADVSQHHHARGYQYHLLGQNECASAYIFYENGRARLEWPVPPLVKPVRKVVTPDRTPVFTDSYDLPSYLLNALTDSRFAAGASSAHEALRMIYANAHPGQLAYLAVISDDARAGQRYAAALADLAPEFRDRGDDAAAEHETI
jgi:hypothetical protein